MREKMSNAELAKAKYEATHQTAEQKKIDALSYKISDWRRILSDVCVDRKNYYLNTCDKLKEVCKTAKSSQEVESAAGYSFLKNFVKLLSNIKMMSMHEVEADFLKDHQENKGLLQELKNTRYADVILISQNDDEPKPQFALPADYDDKSRVNLLINALEIRYDDYKTMKSRATEDAKASTEYKKSKYIFNKEEIAKTLKEKFPTWKKVINESFPEGEAKQEFLKRIKAMESSLQGPSYSWKFNNELDLYKQFTYMDEVVKVLTSAKTIPAHEVQEQYFKLVRMPAFFELNEYLLDSNYSELFLPVVAFEEYYDEYKTKVSINGEDAKYTEVVREKFKEYLEKAKQAKEKAKQTKEEQKTTGEDMESLFKVSKEKEAQKEQGSSFESED